MSCPHMLRTAKADAALADPELVEIRDMVPSYRTRIPEMAHLTDDEIVERIVIFLSSLPRHCDICTGAGKS